MINEEYIAKKATHTKQETVDLATEDKELFSEEDLAEEEEDEVNEGTEKVNLLCG